MNAGTWQPDWPFRAYEALEQLGFHSLSEFMDSRPMVSLVTLADELGTDIAAIQLEELWYREAVERGRIAHLLGSLLIRRIRKAIPAGWATGEEFDSRLAQGFVSWESVADQILPDAARDQVWNWLKNLKPEAGWLPVDPHDEHTANLLGVVERALSRAPR